MSSLTGEHHSALLDQVPGRFKEFLPRTDSLLLRGVIVALAMGCLSLAVLFFCEFIVTGDYVVCLLSSLLWLSLAVGLWLLEPVARYVSLVLLWIIVLAAPFMAGVLVSIDRNVSVAHGHAHLPPTWGPVFYLTVPAYVLGTFCIEALCVYGHEFDEDSDAPRKSLRYWVVWCLAVYGTPLLVSVLVGLAARFVGACIAVESLSESGSTLVVFLLIGAVAGLFASRWVLSEEGGRLSQFSRGAAYTAAMLSACCSFVDYSPMCVAMLGIHHIHIPFFA